MNIFLDISRINFNIKVNIIFIMESIVLKLPFEIYEDPYIFCEEGINPSREREVEVLLSLGNGYIGIRNSLEELYRISDPGCFVSGIYEKGKDELVNRLIKIPNWIKMQVFVDNNPLNIFEDNTLEHRRYIDVREGVGVREWRVQDFEGRVTSIKTIKYASFFNKHESGKVIIVIPENYSGKIKVRSGIDAGFIDKKVSFPVVETVEDTHLTLSMRTRNTDKLVAISQKSDFFIKSNGTKKLEFLSKNIQYERKYEQDFLFEEWEWCARIGDVYNINSLVSVHTSLDTNTPVENSIKHLNENKITCCSSLNNHLKQWNERFAESEIIIENDEFQRDINFAIYHLLISGEFSGINYSIPARNLTGAGYHGHVFWDTEIYLLSFFVFTRPEIARNLLIYRYNTLKCARKNAEIQGHKGASYAWESTDTGLEMAPVSARMPTGEVIPILSGIYECHISSDIAYAVWQYWIATQDEEFMLKYGAEMILESARYNVSLMSLEKDGLYHIPNVEGPDEYHDLVDDNLFTNFMAKFNLVIALKTLTILETINYSVYQGLKSRINLGDSEICEWKKIKDKIYVGIDEESGIYEQFMGFFNLEYINLQDYEPRTAPMDIILGRQRTNLSQVIKQPDVLMFMFLLANWFELETVKKNYDYYEPRTGHGSSLSPSIHSIIAARIGYVDEALRYFRQNAQIDLNNNMGNAALGIHIASHGGSWMSIIFGFAGMQIYENGILFNPSIPEEFGKLKFQLVWRGQKIFVEINTDEFLLKQSGANSIFISAGFNNWIEIMPETAYSAKKQGGHWKWI